MEELGIPSSLWLTSGMTLANFCLRTSNEASDLCMEELKTSLKSEIVDVDVYAEMNSVKVETYGSGPAGFFA